MKLFLFKTAKLYYVTSHITCVYSLLWAKFGRSTDQIITRVGGEINQGTSMHICIAYGHRQ